MNLIQFQFDTNEIRVVEIDGEPWFVARDVCFLLGYANTKSAIDDNCHGVARSYPIVDALGRDQAARIISEPDLMRLIVRSRLPAAQRFERWVFEDVLPTLRRTGRFATVPQSFQVPKTFSEALRLAADQAEQNAVLVAKVEEQAPKVAALDRIADADGRMTLTLAAKNIGMHPHRFMAWLAEMKWIYKSKPGGPWIAYEIHIANGSLEHKVFVTDGATETSPERAFTQVMVTAQGLTKLARILETRARGQEQAARAAFERLGELVT